ncbi:MAG: hypothetical protein AMJ60_11500 [Desulfobacterales bacterium SG8_35]|nr:MAG: hypothetical protein AMJ60_11500 [Desulfobacterales bacterium SG8_35]
MKSHYKPPWQILRLCRLKQKFMKMREFCRFLYGLPGNLFTDDRYHIGQTKIIIVSMKQFICHIVAIGMMSVL